MREVYLATTLSLSLSIDNYLSGFFQSITDVIITCQAGFLTDDLTVHDDQGEGSGCKYLGVCKLEGEGRKASNFLAWVLSLHV